MQLDGAVKEYRSYDEQGDLLIQRGMDVGDRDEAVALLRRVSYYRLSGYWYPFRQIVGSQRQDDFYSGTRLADVAALYEFDARLRTAAFAELSRIELAIRALLGHELGRVDPCAHLEPNLLGPTARSGGSYADWLAGYEFELQHAQRGLRRAPPAEVRRQAPRLGRCRATRLRRSASVFAGRPGKDDSTGS